MFEKGKEVEGWTAFQMRVCHGWKELFPIFFSGARRFFSSHRRSSTGSVVVTMSPLSQITCKTKTRGKTSEGTQMKKKVVPSSGYHFPLHKKVIKITLVKDSPPTRAPAHTDTAIGHLWHVSDGSLC